MKLREFAHSRTGDKGNISNISVIVYNKEHYEMIKQQVTATKVKEWFGDIVQGEVVRHEIPSLGAMNFVLYQALSGGVTKSLALDTHGKSLSSKILDMDLRFK